jgi:hypothetical protein
MYRQLREQVLIPWIANNYLTDDPDSLAPYPTAQINPPEDNEAEGNALGLLGDACTKLEPHGADTALILEAHGVPMKDPEVIAAEKSERAAIAAKALEAAQKNQVPAEGEEELEHDETAQEAPKSSAALTTSLTMSMLKASGPGALKRIAKYHNAIVAKATRSAASAMGGDLDAILSDIEAATSPDDLKRRVFSRFKKMKGTSELADILRRTNTLANLMGRVDVIKGT